MNVCGLDPPLPPLLNVIEFGVFAVTVVEPPSATLLPLTVTELLVSAEFGMLVSPEPEPLNDVAVTLPLAVTAPTLMGELLLPPAV